MILSQVLTMKLKNTWRYGRPRLVGRDMLGLIHKYEICKKPWFQIRIRFGSAFFESPDLGPDPCLIIQLENSKI